MHKGPKHERNDLGNVQLTRKEYQLARKLLKILYKLNYTNIFNDILTYNKAKCKWIHVNILLYNLILILKSIFDRIVNKLKKELLKMNYLTRIIQFDKRRKVFWFPNVEVKIAQKKLKIKILWLNQFHYTLMGQFVCRPS